MTVRVTVVLLVIAMFAITTPDLYADGPVSDRPETSEYIREVDTPTGVFAPIIRMLFSRGNSVSRSPSGCIQRSKTPRRWGNNVKGEVRVRCNARVTRMRHTAELMRWEGLLSGGWDGIGTIGEYNGRNTRSGTAYGITTCTRHKFKVTGAGYVLDVDGVKYHNVGTTSRIANNPCRID